MSGLPDEMPAKLRIDIGVCTFRRPELMNTLCSLAALRVPGEAVLRIIVADNDVTPSARERVEWLAGGIPHEIRYVHAPAQNISVARNACLDHAEGDFLAFIDDDETADRDWLAKLLEEAQATGADAVLGPVKAEYGFDAPQWMRRGDFHSTFPVWVNGTILTGYTCNALLRLASPAVAGRRFSLALGRTGGEDTEFFSKIYETGGRIAYAPEAWVHEIVPAQRARFSWLAKRRFRSGQTHGRLLAEKRSGPGLLPAAALAGAKAAYCFTIAAVMAFLPTHRNRSLLRGILHTGAVSGMLGLREIRQYGEIRPVGEQGNAT